MSRSINQITLLGHVGRDPDVNQTKNGTKVANFSVATLTHPHEGGQPEASRLRVLPRLRER